MEDSSRWNFAGLSGLLDTAANVASDRLKAKEAPKPQQVPAPASTAVIQPRPWLWPVVIGVVVLLAVFGLRKLGK